MATYIPEIISISGAFAEAVKVSLDGEMISTLTPGIPIYREGVSYIPVSGMISMAQGPSSIIPLQVDSSKHLQVDIAADSVGIGGGTQYSDGESAATPSGTLVMWNKSGVMTAASVAEPLPVTGVLTVDVSSYQLSSDLDNVEIRSFAGVPMAMDASGTIGVEIISPTLLLGTDFSTVFGTSSLITPSALKVEEQGTVDVNIIGGEINATITSIAQYAEDESIPQLSGIVNLVRNSAGALSALQLEGYTYGGGENDDTTFQQGVLPSAGYTGCTDTVLDSDASTSNFDADGYVGLGSSTANKNRHTIIRFDVSSIPSNAMVISATLTIRYIERVGEAFSVSTYALKRNWVESQATWNVFSTGNTWGAGGGSGSADVYAKESTAVVTAANAVFSIPVMVQGWIDGSLTNYGVNLIPDTTVAWSRYWAGYDSESSAAYRSSLEVVYSLSPLRSGIVVMAEGPGNTTVPLQVDASKHLQVDIAADSVGISGVQYSEGDTDSSITGTAILWEGAGDTLRTISQTYPLPVSGIMTPTKDSVKIFSNTAKDGTGTNYTPLVDTDGHLQIDVLTGGSGGTQYSEGDVDTTITGTATMWEDGADTLRAVSKTYPLPISGMVQDGGGSITVDATGNVAHDAADSGAPIKIGAKAISFGTSPTAVAANDRTDLYASRYGIPWVIGGFPNTEVLTGKYTSAQTDTVLKSVAAGQKFIVTMLSAMVGNIPTTAGCGVRFEFDGATDISIGEHPNIAAGSGFVMGTGAGIIAAGADAQDLLVTTGNPSGEICVAVTGFLITES